VRINTYNRATGDGTPKAHFSTFYFSTSKKSSINHIMSKIYKIRKNRMKQTLNVYFKNSYKSAAACAREFDLDSRLFQKRLKTERSRFNRVINIKLSDHQKLTLKKYIEFLDSIEISARLSIIRDTANFLLYKAHDDCDEALSRVKKN
jgi:DNA-directed RNA polymerase specialized sigma24 family protein